MIHVPGPDGTDYRADIDGLRAVAVLSVILFHLDAGLLPGGFLGVDVFFVISGFLITRNIVQEMVGGRFSVAEFYRRRIKRIAPAMLVVVAVTMLTAQWLLLPEDARAAAKSAVFSLLSAANFYFCYYSDSDYFAADSHHLPLLHLWSLGVEEQFYLLWPWLLLLLYHPGRRQWLLLPLLLIVALASFALGQIYYPLSPASVYYMLPTRAGELLLGAIPVLVFTTWPALQLPRACRIALAVLGIVLLGTSLLLLDVHHPFPGWAALPPTLGTALLIVCGRGTRQRPLINRLLSTAPLVGIGLISYSAYLWHWPLIAFYRYGYGEPGLLAATILLLLTLLAAWGSYRYVELPLRASRARAGRVFLTQYALPASVLGAFALWTYYDGGLSGMDASRAYRARLEALQAQTAPALGQPFICQRQRIQSADLINPHCVGGTAAAPGVNQAILWGDSNAAHYIGMLDVIAKRAGFSLRNLETGLCPPLLSDPRVYLASQRVSDCEASWKLTAAAVQNYPVIIVSSDWMVYQDQNATFLPVFFASARRLARSGKLLIILGRVPIFPGYDPQCWAKMLHYPFLKCEVPAQLPDARIAAINARLRTFAQATPNVRYFDAVDYICPAQRCRPLDAAGNLLYHDPRHLSLRGSIALGGAILAHEGVPAAFREVTAWRP